MCQNSVSGAPHPLSGSPRDHVPEETVLADRLHDVVFNLIKVDHGWWGAQFMEQYVLGRVSWKSLIRYVIPPVLAFLAWVAFRDMVITLAG